jgi:hypothetical protein
MFTRRNVVAGVVFAGFATAVGGRLIAAKAGGVPGSNPNLALASPDHLPLIAEAQSKLRQDIALGMAADDAQRSFVCPICCYRITVTARACF